MSLEAAVTELNGNIVKLIAALGNGAAPAASAPAAAAPTTTGKKGTGTGTGAKVKVPTAEEVAEVAKAHMAKHGKPATKKLIQDHGGADLASLPEGNRAAFIAAAKAAMEDGGDDDDDGL